MSNPQYAQPATGYGLQRTDGGSDSSQQGDGKRGAGSGIGTATGFGMERVENHGSERTGAFESQYAQHVATGDAINEAQLAIARNQEQSFARLIDALVDNINPEYRSRTFPLTSVTAANLGVANQLVWEVPMEGQWTLDKIQLLTADGASYPDYVRVDVPDVGTPLYLNSALTVVEPRTLTVGNQRVTISSVSSTGKNGVLIVIFRRLNHIARRRTWMGEY